MKSFKSLVEGGTLDEAMGGKGTLQFNGIDEVGDFWIVLSADMGYELSDMFFKADIFDVHLQMLGGLKGYNILGIYKSKGKAKKAADKELARATKMPD